MEDIKVCPFCKREKKVEDIHGADRDWKPTLYDPDSGGDPLYIVCECGLTFSTGTYDYKEFVEAWNTRKPINDIVEQLEKQFEENADNKWSATIIKVWNRAVQICIKIVNGGGKK